MIQEIFDCFKNPKIHSITKFIDRNKTIKVTKIRKTNSYIVTIGKPNYEARQLIKKSGNKLPEPIVKYAKILRKT